MTPPDPSAVSWEQMLIKMVDNLQTTVTSMDRKLDEMRTGMVPRPEFEAAQRGIDQRFATLTAQIGEKREAHANLEAKIQAVDDKADAAAKDRHTWSRELNARVWIAIGTSVLGTGLAAVAAVIGLN